MAVETDVITKRLKRKWTIDERKTERKAQTIAKIAAWKLYAAV